MKKIKKEKTLSEMLKDEYEKRAAMTPEELKRYNATISDDGISSMPFDGIMESKNTPKK